MIKHRACVWLCFDCWAIWRKCGVVQHCQGGSTDTCAHNKHTVLVLPVSKLTNTPTHTSSSNAPPVMLGTRGVVLCEGSHSVVGIAHRAGQRKPVVKIAEQNMTQNLRYCPRGGSRDRSCRGWTLVDFFRIKTTKLCTQNTTKRNKFYITSPKFTIVWKSCQKTGKNRAPLAHPLQNATDLQVCAGGARKFCCI